MMLWLVVWALVAAKPMLPPLPPLEGEVERIVVDKSQRLMLLYQDGAPVRAYRVHLGFDPEGPKSVQGDGRTPEGVFRIDRRNDGSAFHLSLGIDYPQDAHRKAARALGRSPGGDIFIHGQPNAMPAGMMMKGDWTDGCIAVRNREIEEIWAVVPAGTPVEIRP